LKLLEVGRVGRAHGLSGEVRVHLHWADSEALYEASQVELALDGKVLKYDVESARPTNKAVLLKLAGVDDRSAAEALSGARVSVSREALAPLEEGEYYLTDLIGARVRAPDASGELEEIGEVVEVRLHPSVDALVVRLSDGTLAEQVLADPWLGRVDAEAGIVELVSRDGLVA
jgi:16S rRNA processing protein RimM